VKASLLVCRKWATVFISTSLSSLDAGRFFQPSCRNLSIPSQEFSATRTDSTPSHIKP